METENTMGADGGMGPAKRKTPIWPTVLRILMGLAFFASGVVFFTMPPPNPPMPAKAMDFGNALKQTGYMMPLVMGTQLLVGILLLVNRFVPLALALIAPIIVGIITFHVFLEPAGIIPGVIILIIELALAWAYRDAFRPMLAAKTRPS